MNSVDGMAIPTVTENDPVAPLHVLLNTLGSAANNDIAALQEELDDYTEATDDRLDAIEGMVSDTGWQPITPLSGFTATNGAAVRRIGDMVYIRGSIKRTAGNFPTSYTNCATLPSGFAPQYGFRAAGAGWATTTNNGMIVAVAAGSTTIQGASIGAGSDTIYFGSVTPWNIAP